MIKTKEKKKVGRMSRFLRFCAFLSVLFFTGNLMAAGYTCSTTATYTSCKEGYYLEACGTEESDWSGQTAIPVTGKTCLTCPDGYECSGGQKCPLRTGIHCTAGTYIKAGDTKCTSCPAGKYCSGFDTDDKAATETDRGITGTCPAGSYCPTGTGTPKSCPPYYGNSATGSDAESDCYTSCAIGTAVFSPGTACAYDDSAIGMSWYSSAAHNVYYGKISPINYCPYGSDMRGMASSLHDSGADCLVTVPAGYKSVVTTSTAQYIRISSEQGAFPLAEIMVFYNGVPQTLSPNSPMTNSGYAIDSNLSNFAVVSTTSAQGFMAMFKTSGVVPISDIKFALAGGVTREILIEISADATTWTTVFNGIVSGVGTLPAVMQNVPVKVRTNTKCTAGTYHGETTVPATNSVTCTPCPPAADHKMTSYSNLTDAAYVYSSENLTFESIELLGWDSLKGGTSIESCAVSYNYNNSRGYFTIEAVRYNSSTEKYDKGGNLYYRRPNAGYYLTTRYSDTYCSGGGTYMLYQDAQLCPAGSYCSGRTSLTACSSGTYGDTLGIDGSVSVGYYSTGGGTSATPTAAGNGCVSGQECGPLAAGYFSVQPGMTTATPTYMSQKCDLATIDGVANSMGCGTVAAGYYSTGGGTHPRPTASGNGCIAGKKCGTVAAGYYSTGGAKSETGDGAVHAGYYSTGGATAPVPESNEACVGGNSCGLLSGGYFSTGGATKATPTSADCVGVVGPDIWSSSTSPVKNVCGQVLGGYYSIEGAILPAPGELGAKNTAALGFSIDYLNQGLDSVRAGCLGGSSKCGMVSAGYFASGGATSSTPSSADCVSGTCGICEKGQFSYAGATSCSSCPALGGSNWAWNMSRGAKSYSECKRTGVPDGCNAGKVTDTASSETTWGNRVLTEWAAPGNAQLLAKGGYQIDVINLKCTICPNGHYSPGNVSSCAPVDAGYYATGAATSSAPSSANCVTGTCGFIDAGYWGEAGATTVRGSGVVAPGYYSTGGGTSATPTAPGNGCLSGKQCGGVNAGYWNDGCGINATGGVCNASHKGGLVNAGYWNDGCGINATGGVCNRTHKGGQVNAGYYNLGGGTSPTPEVRGTGCVNVSTTQCGTVAPGYWGEAGATQYGGSGAVRPGYYSTGGATSKTPSASDCVGKVAIIENGKLMGASDVDNTCGQVQAGYWNNACGINATGGVCSTNYQGGVVDAGYYATGGATSAQGHGIIKLGLYSTCGATSAGDSGGVLADKDYLDCVSGCECGRVAAGYFATGGGTSPTPTAAGNGCLSGQSCGTMAAGYYSRGGAGSATASGQYCWGYNKYSDGVNGCGKLSAEYYSNGGSTDNGATCVSGKTCGTCDANYRANTETGKTSASQCQASCAAGTRVATVNAACTSPAGGWFSAAHLVNYGQISPVNYCMSGYTSASTSASGHDAKSDCVQTVAGGKYVPSSKINARYIKITSDGSVSVSGSTNPSTHLLEMQAFASSDGTGTNLLSGKGAVAGDKMSAVTNGNWTRGDGYSYGEGSPMILDLGSVQALGSLKFAMYTDGREYQNVVIAVSEDNTTYTTVFTANELLTQNTTTPTGELVVLSAAPKSCAAGTSKASGTVALGNTTTCGTCANWTYSGAGAASCTACPAVESGYAKLDSTGTGWTTYQKCVEIATASPEKCTSGKLQKIPTASGATTWATATVNSNNPLGAEPGYYVNGTACSACGDNNHYCAGGTAARKEVQSGYYSTGGTSSATRTGESQCKSGTYCVSGVQKQCSALTPAVLTGTNGTFSSADGSVVSTACRYTPQTVTDTECSSITANTVSYSGSAWGTNYYTAKAKAGAHVSATGNTAAPACALCAAGTYQGTNGSSATTCTSADKGYYVAGEGATSQTKCVMGSYTDTTGQSACKACAGGKTNSEDGATSCTAACSNATGVASTGWETPVWGTDNKMTNLCTVKATAGCSANYYKNSNACTACPSATYPYSVAGATEKTQCYANVTLSKNGFSGSIAAGLGTGCKVASAATGTNNATLQVYYNTECTLPTISGFTQTGYTAASGWASVNTIGASAVTKLPASTSKPAATYYARKTTCGADYYKKDATTCSTCASGTDGNYTKSAAGTASDVNVCYLNTTAKNFVKTPGAGQITCEKGNYCPGSVKVYYGGTASDTHPTTGGSTQCPANSYCVAGVSEPVACSTLVGGLYKNSNAGSDAAEDCNFTTTGGTYLSEDGVVTDCEAKYYCPATKLNYPSTGGRYDCPDPTVSANVDAIADVAWLSSACPDATTSNSSIVSANWQGWGNTKLSAKSQCPALINIDTPCTKFQIQSAKFNTTTGKYDADTAGAARIASTVKAGYYFTEPYKANYCTNAPTALMYYKTAAKCTANSYCPGATVPRCDSGKHTYGEPFGIYACTSLGDFYTTSVAGATANTACYGKTTKTKYVANANDKTETTCAENGYCVGNATVYYGSTGGRTACVAPYGLAAAGSDDANDCYLKTTAGQYVETAGAGQITCPAGYWCVGDVAIYKGGSVTGRSTTGGSEQCPAGYRDGTTGYSLQSQCTMNVLGGKYVAEANESSASGTCKRGYAKEAHPVTYGETSSCDACTGATYAAQEGMDKCEPCPTVSGASGYGYWNTSSEAGNHTVRAGCQASFKNASIADGNLTMYSCYVDASADTYGVKGDGKGCWVNRPHLTCNGGYYNKKFNDSTSATQDFTYKTSSDLLENVCRDVESGYWSGADSLTRTACETGLVTCGAGLCANEAGDCGRKLHAGDNVIYLRSEKRTTPSLNVKIGDKMFYGNLGDVVANSLRVKNGTKNYSVVNDNQ